MIFYVKPVFYNFRYKNASKTDVKQSWLKCPKTKLPKEVKTISELYPQPKEFRYNILLIYIINLAANDHTLKIVYIHKE